MSENSDLPATSTTRVRRDRLADLGHRSNMPRRKPLVELDAKGRLLLEYLTVGCSHDWISQYTRHSPTEFDPDRRRPLEKNEPLTLLEAAAVLRIKRRYARWIATQKVFQRELALALGAMRDGMKAKALLVVGEILEDPGDNSAAVKKVRLSAAQTLLGDAVGPTPAKAPNVSVNITNQMQPGIVIRLPANLPQTPLERQTIEAPQIIEHHPLSHEQRAITQSNEDGDERD